MIIIMKPHATAAEIGKVEEAVRSRGLTVHESKGEQVTIIGVVGDKTKLSGANLESFAGVEKLVPVTESYKLCNIKFHPARTVVRVKGASIGDGFAVIAGPCAVESEEQMFATAAAVKAAGATILRGGAYKPRTSPYSFQGLGETGLKILKAAADSAGLPCVTEVIDFESLDTSLGYVDMIQIGARNMQNFELLKEAGRAGKPVILKRGMSATIDEWLNAAEYIMSSGNAEVVLCERGIRTFERATRNTLDISAVPVLRARTHLPVIVDPSHAAGVRAFVAPLARAAKAVGADGAMIEVHCNPGAALSDGEQSLSPDEFTGLMRSL